MICACEDLETMHLDIKCAFQNGKLYDIVYVVQPYEWGDISGRVWKLKTAWYGLKQAAREWHKELVSLLHEFHSVHSHSDPALFIASMAGVSSSSGLMTCLCSELLISWNRCVPRYCQDSKAGVKAKLDCLGHGNPA